MEALRVENLSKDFGGLRALNNLSFSIKEEKRVAIIGPNGAGKTTLFNVISGALSPSSGNIYIYSKDATQLPQYERTKLGLARTYQVTNLFFNFPVMDNVLLAKLGQDRSKFNMICKLSSLRDLWEESEQLLEKWGFTDKQKFLVRDLSHGEQRQLELVLGLASKPKILLLDEPTAGLGKTETDLVISNIREFLKDIVVLMIEHDMRVAFAVAERIIVLHRGQIIADGKPDEVRTYPKVREAYLGMQGEK
jgi:branched-chain amino acid transport system ATP-binding protein